MIRVLFVILYTFALGFITGVRSFISILPLYKVLSDFNDLFIGTALGIDPVIISAFGTIATISTIVKIAVKSK